MNKITKLSLISLLVMLTVMGCKDHENDFEVTVITHTPTVITDVIVQCGGHVAITGTTQISELGVCWGTEQDPEVTDCHLSNLTASESFTCILTGLLPETQYHVRAYALCESEYYYGEDFSFTTLKGGSGLFSVSETSKVRFSPGNLQYQASTNTWRFAEHQWDFVGYSEPDQYGMTYGTVSGSSNHLIDSSYDGWIDLFGWGTSGYDHGAACYQPWSISVNDEDYYVHGDPNLSLFEWNHADWGTNPISNGGNVADVWRTLTYEEWMYLLKERVTKSGLRYVPAILNDVKGIIILPDEWDNTVFQLVYDPHSFSYNSNTITLDEWDIVEDNGAVFLPLTGKRNGVEVSGGYDYGGYWSSSSISWIGESSPHTAWCLQLFDGMVAFPNVNRHTGLAVRLVHD